MFILSTGLIEYNIAMVLSVNDIDTISLLLSEGKIGVLPTDTIYGIHCLENRKDLIDKISCIKGREKSIPMITMICSNKDLMNFGVKLGEFEDKIISEYWPGPNTLIFDLEHNVTKSFRLPNNHFLLSVIKKSGSLVSTSANPHGMSPSTNINQAIRYFGKKVDFYVDGGELDNPPSSIYKLSDNKLVKIR